MASKKLKISYALIAYGIVSTGLMLLYPPPLPTEPEYVLGTAISLTYSLGLTVVPLIIGLVLLIRK